MHPYLERLGIRFEVQEFFAPFYYSDEAGNLCLTYSDGFEHYGLGFHQVPLFAGDWRAGNHNFSQVDTLIICASAMESIAWLNQHWHHLSDPFSLYFFSGGVTISSQQTTWLRKCFARKKVVIALGNDLLGRLSAVKLAAALRGHDLQVCYLAEEKVRLLFRGQTFLFSPASFSVNALEKSAGFRFRVVISNPKNHNTFFEQVKAAAGLSF